MDQQKLLQLSNPESKITGKKKSLEKKNHSETVHEGVNKKFGLITSLLVAASFLANPIESAPVDLSTGKLKEITPDIPLTGNLASKEVSPDTSSFIENFVRYLERGMPKAQPESGDSLNDERSLDALSSRLERRDSQDITEEYKHQEMAESNATRLWNKKVAEFLLEEDNAHKVVDIVSNDTKIVDAMLANKEVQDTIRETVTHLEVLDALYGNEQIREIIHVEIDESKRPNVSHWEKVAQDVMNLAIENTEAFHAMLGDKKVQKLKQAMIEDTEVLNAIVQRMDIQKIENAVTGDPELMRAISDNKELIALTHRIPDRLLTGNAEGLQSPKEEVKGSDWETVTNVLGAVFYVTMTALGSVITFCMLRSSGVSPFAAFVYTSIR